MKKTIPNRPITLLNELKSQNSNGGIKPLSAKEVKKLYDWINAIEIATFKLTKIMGWTGNNINLLNKKDIETLRLTMEGKVNEYK